MTEQYQLPSTGFVRLKDVLKLIPVCKSTWYNGVGTIYPKPMKIGKRAMGYRVEDIRLLIKHTNSLANKNYDE
jgi:prophage regulatory protein